MAENTRLATRRSKGALRRQDPFEMLNALQDDLDRFWRVPFRIGPPGFPFGRITESVADFAPRMACTSKTTPSSSKPSSQG
jgi:hypothetical protein